MNGAHVTQDGLVTVKEHLEKQIKHLEYILQMEIDNSEKALNLAKAELERRMEGFPEIYIKKEEIRNDLNELRNKIDDLVTKISLLELAGSELKGKASKQSQMMVLAIALTSFVLGSIGLAMRTLHF